MNNPRTSTSDSGEFLVRLHETGDQGAQKFPDGLQITLWMHDPAVDALSCASVHGASKIIEKDRLGIISIAR